MALEMLQNGMRLHLFTYQIATLALTNRIFSSILNHYWKEYELIHPAASGFISPLSIICSFVRQCILPEAGAMLISPLLLMARSFIMVDVIMMSLSSTYTIPNHFSLC